MHIAILSASVRTGRNSHRVALYFKHYISNNYPDITIDIIDLNEYQFPVFNERLKYMPEPSAGVLEFAERITKADGVIIVTPEYNGGYPAALKNVIDLLYAEWKKKPIAIATASDGSFGASQVITSLVFSLWKIGAWVVPAMFPVPKVQEAFTEDGTPIDIATTGKRAKIFTGELLWCIQAAQLMKERV